MTGFTPEQVRGIIMREGGICAMYGANPGCEHRARTANHRLNRGAGGSKLRNGTDNGCAICDTCNGAIEDDAELAEIARHRGVKLRAGDRPELVPFWCVFYRQWTQLVGDSMLLTGLTDPKIRPTLDDPNRLDGL